LRSNVSFLRAGIQDADFSHILSFCCQTSINHDDVEKHPRSNSSILINYDDINYKVFISDDSLTFFICKNQGHIASKCPDKVKILDNNKTATHILSQKKIIQAIHIKPNQKYQI